MMAPLLKSILKRLLLLIIPYCGLYVYTQFAFEKDSQREHYSNAGLGIAVFGMGILTLLILIFLVDLFRKIRSKNRKLIIVDLVFLSVLSIPLILDFGHF